MNAWQGRDEPNLRRQRPGRLPGIGSHHSARVDTDEWLTPPEIIDDLGPFDLDPCAPETQPWPTAERTYTATVDGLQQDWHGYVWLNPPYSEIEPWMGRLATHNNGIGLVFARTETRWWFESVWPVASAIMFLEGRLHFHRPDGTRAEANSGAPSALVAYGLPAANKLARTRLHGAVVTAPLLT